MEYNVILKEKSYDLPKLSMKINNRMEEIEIKKENLNTQASLKLEYDFCAETIGKENALEVLGKFMEADPNEINIAYLSIVEAFHKPLTDYQNEKASEQFDNELVEKAIKIIEGAKGIKELK